MNGSSGGSDLERAAAALGVWENEGGAPGHPSRDNQYGRRIEADRSWTVYHVFSGVPAHVQGNAMTGLTRSDATSSMQSLNLRNIASRLERIALPRIARKTGEGEIGP